MRISAAPVAGTSPIAVGNPGRAAEGFRRTHCTPTATQRVMELTGSAQVMTVRREVALLALLPADPEQAA